MDAPLIDFTTLPPLWLQWNSTSSWVDYNSLRIPLVGKLWGSWWWRWHRNLWTNLPFGSGIASFSLWRASWIVYLWASFDDTSWFGRYTRLDSFSQASSSFWIASLKCSSSPHRIGFSIDSMLHHRSNLQPHRIEARYSKEGCVSWPRVMSHYQGFVLQRECFNTRLPKCTTYRIWSIVDRVPLLYLLTSEFRDELHVAGLFFRA